MKNVVIYFSRKGQNYVSGSIQNLEKGNAEVIAEYIDEIIGADVFEVERETPYSLDYTECTKQAQDEMRNHPRPSLKNTLESIADYDNIFLVGPCWWGTYPMPMFTQIDALDFTNKDVYPIMTHEGSGMGSVERDLKKYCTGANLHKGLAIHGTYAKQSKEDISSWINRELGK